MSDTYECPRCKTKTVKFTWYKGDEPFWVCKRRCGYRSAVY